MFLDRLRSSSGAVFVVGHWLHALGEYVEMPPIRYAPDAASAPDYIDCGDLFATKNGRRRLIEIKKRREIKFNSVVDYPYPDIMVSNVAAVDRRVGEVAAYVIVSADLAAAAIIPATTRPHWFVLERKMKNTGNVERVYTCPKNKATFIRLDA